VSTATQTSRRDRPHAEERADALALVLLAGVMLGAAALFLWKGRGLIFYYDEWAFIVDRRGWSPDTFLEPHNEHLSAIPIVVYKLLFAVTGLEPYWPYRLSVVAAHLLVAVLVFLVARRAAGSLVAVAAATVILFLGSAWEDILWPFQIGYLLSVAVGLGAILFLDLRSFAGDLAAAVLLAVSLASASIGIPIALTLLVLLAVEPNRLRRGWVVAAPLALYAIWWLGYGRTQPEVGGDFQTNLPNLPTYVADAISGALVGLTGLSAEWGRPLALATVVAIAWAFAHSRLFPVRAAAFAAGGLAFWALAGLTRGQLNSPASSRYVYFGAIVIVLVAVELTGRLPLGPVGAGLLVVFVGASALGNYRNLESGVAHLREYTGFVGSSFGALELAGPGVDPTYRPDPVHAPNVYAGSYFEAVRELGSPAFTPDEIRRQAEHHRQAADSVLIAALGITPRPAGPGEEDGAPPAVDSVANAQIRVSGACLTVEEANVSTLVYLRVAGERLVIRPEERAFVELAVRRFAAEYGQTAGMTLPPGPSAIGLPTLGLGFPWRARVATTGPVAVCGSDLP
jgi:hypothetical protein